MPDGLLPKELAADIVHDSIHGAKEAETRRKFRLTADCFPDKRQREIIKTQDVLIQQGGDHLFLALSEKVGSELHEYMTNLDPILPGPIDYESKCRKYREQLDAKRFATKLRILANSEGMAYRERVQALKDLLGNNTNGKFEDDWRCFTLEDAYQERPLLEYVVEGLFPLPSLSIPYGAPGHLKTLLMQDMALCVAAGLDWLPPRPDNTVLPIKTVPVSVMWVDFDNGTRRTHDRIEALAKARQLKPNTPFFYYSFPTPRLKADGMASIEAMQKRMEGFETKLLIIDNLKAISGDADENSAEMGNVLGNLRMLSENTGSAIVVIHHQRKSGGKPAREGDKLRGHSSIEASIDLALLVEREGEDSPNVMVRSTKTRGADVERFGAHFTYEWKPDSKELAEARFYGMPVSAQIRDAQVEEAIKAVIDESGQINQSDLKSKVREMLPKAGLNKIGVIADQMGKNGIIKTITGANNAKIYTV
jgi:hypothetical protein